MCGALRFKRRSAFVVSAGLNKKHSTADIKLYACGGPGLRHVSDGFCYGFQEEPFSFVELFLAFHLSH